jgi:transcriptional regulator with AAA-type ATPase domain
MNARLHRRDKSEGRFSRRRRTIFLDEIGVAGELAKLHGAAEGLDWPADRKLTPRSPPPIGISAATREGSARIYYRLNVFPIELPPLRDRGDDIGLLAENFARRFAQRMGRAIESLSEDCIRRLKSYGWPGNVRELQNVIERGVITSRDGRVNLDRALPESGKVTATEAGSPEGTAKRVRTAKELEELERTNLIAALEATS